MKLILLLLLCVLLIHCRSQSDSEHEASARVILYKSTETNPVAEGVDFLVSYQIINIGDVTGINIDIVDKYDPKSFETTENINEDGNVAFSLKELAPGGQASFNVTVRPKLFGIYESTRARIKYINSALNEMEGVESDYRSGYSTSLGRIKIISAAEYARKSSHYIREWSVFLAVLSLTSLLPFVIWIVTNAASIKLSVKRKTT
mmetsp:Transcript_11547/g.15864  ORF Transcript_11547/g.15864 Transcript_11547/m.15864 type:complete len:204 (+) Transcript_11547:18-629(+)